MNIFEYVQANALQLPADSKEEGAVSVHFFKVKPRPGAFGATAEKFREAIKAHKGEFRTVDPLDGNEHGYIELGAWAGDQGAALLLMGLGECLGVWKVMSPEFMMPSMPDLWNELAGAGYVTVRAFTTA